jgi:ubiquitin C-terminal hydrolase
LYFSSFFLEDFKKAPVSKNSLFQALKAVFAELAQSKQRYHSPSKLIDLKNTSLFPKGSQGDSAEFFKYVLDAYCTTIKNEDIPFSGKIETSIRCLHCNYESHSDERFVELSLPFPDADEKSSGLSIETLLDSYFLEPVRLSGDSMYFCSSCNVKREASSQTKLKILPMHLAICLKRFMFDKETLSRSKILTVRSL